MSEDSYEDDRRSRLADQINDIVHNLGELEKSSRRSFPERYFVGIFLPYFAADEERAYPQANAQMWVTRVAGSAFQEVDILGDRQEVLFTVPPMMDRGAIDPQQGVDAGGVPVAHIVASANQLSRVSPNLGARHLREELTKKALIMRAPASVVRNIAIWNQIFERYGRPAMMALDEEQAQSSSPDAAVQPPLLGGEMELL